MESLSILNLGALPKIYTTTNTGIFKNRCPHMRTQPCINKKMDCCSHMSLLYTPLFKMAAQVLRQFSVGVRGQQQTFPYVPPSYHSHYSSVPICPAHLIKIWVSLTWWWCLSFRSSWRSTVQYSTVLLYLKRNLKVDVR